MVLIVHTDLKNDIANTIAIRRRVRLPVHPSTCLASPNPVRTVYASNYENYFGQAIFAIGKCRRRFGMAGRCGRYYGGPLVPPCSKNTHHLLQQKNTSSKKYTSSNKIDLLQK